MDVRRFVGHIMDQRLSEKQADILEWFKILSDEPFVEHPLVGQTSKHFTNSRFTYYVTSMRRDHVTKSWITIEDELYLIHFYRKEDHMLFKMAFGGFGD